MDSETLKHLQNKFFNDPDWHLVSGMIEKHLEPLYDIMTIDTKSPGISNDQIATEVRGRQQQIEGLSKFLVDTKLLSRPIARRGRLK